MVIYEGTITKFTIWFPYDFSISSISKYLNLKGCQDRKSRNKRILVTTAFYPPPLILCLEAVRC